MITRRVTPIARALRDAPANPDPAAVAAARRVLEAAKAATVKRGDLAVIRRDSHVSVQHGDGYDSTSYEVAVVTSVTRDGAVKAVRGFHETAQAEQVARMGRHQMVTIPATAIDVQAVGAAVRAARGNESGWVPPYHSPVELLRDLKPHAWAPDALAAVAAAAHRHVQDKIAFNRATCARCGVITYGHGAVDADTDGIPVAVCKSCPAGVDFKTAYPVGLEVMVTDGFAAGAVARIEAVADAYPTDPHTGNAHYAGRSYTVTLPCWGQRTLGEDYLRPTDDAAADRYAVARNAPAPGPLANPMDPACDTDGESPVPPGTAGATAASGDTVGAASAGTAIANNDHPAPTGGPEVTGLVTARRYARGMTDALTAQAQAIELFVSSLSGAGVSGQAVAAAARAQALTGAAASAWETLHSALGRQSLVRDAYATMPEAGAKNWVTR